MRNTKPDQAILVGLRWLVGWLVLSSRNLASSAFMVWPNNETIKSNASWPLRYENSFSRVVVVVYGGNCHIVGMLVMSWTVLRSMPSQFPELSHMSPVECSTHVNVTANEIIPNILNTCALVPIVFPRSAPILCLKNIHKRVWIVCENVPLPKWEKRLELFSFDGSKVWDIFRIGVSKWNDPILVALLECLYLDARLSQFIESLRQS